MKKLFNGVYNGKKVLLTGHTGFKGSWLLLWLEQLGAEVTGISLAPEEPVSHFQYIKGDFTSVIDNICNPGVFEKLVEKVQPDIVFHLAAQSLVRRGYAQPLLTYETNILGSVQVLEAIRKSSSVKAFVNITTDKVYSNKELEQGYKEVDVLGGKDPYSTSKACVELVHAAYASTFLKENKIQNVTVRAGNVIGGGDWSEDRLIPDIVRAIYQNNPVIIRNPTAVRPWQHVLEPLSAYLLLGQKLLEGDEKINGAWNIGPENNDCITVQSLISELQKEWPGWEVSYESQIHTSLTEANLLKLDITKAKEQLNWQPVWNIKKALSATASWYKIFKESGKISSIKDLENYIAAASAANKIWTK